MSTEKANKNTPAEKQAERVTYPLGKFNFICMAVCLVLIVVGFWLMSGSANEGDTFNYDIFESRRTVVGPFIAFAGFVLMAFAIIFKKKNKDDELNQK